MTAQSSPHEPSLIGCLRITFLSSILILGTVASAGLIAWKWIQRDEPPSGYAGSPRRGRELLSAYGCPACHEIPGAAPAGMVGPPLDHIASRSYIAGRIPNKRIDMEQWIQYPQAMKPGTAMPNLAVTRADARDIATYLATLK